MRRIGIYSGTFDPVHEGHIAFALEAKRACGLDEVVFLPERLPRGKNNVSPIADRITWLQQNLSGEGLRVVELASDRFTVQETLPELVRLFPDAKLTLLLGSDVVRTFPHRWPGLKELLASVSLAVGMRGDHSPEEVHAIMLDLEKSHEISVTYNIIRAQHAHLTSSQIRQRPNIIV